MRTFLSLAAVAALALSPIATAQTAPASASAPHAINSTEDFAYNSNPSVTGCTSWSQFDPKMNKVFVATCKSQEQFTAAFTVGEKMSSNCKQQSEGYVCEISQKRG